MSNDLKFSVIIATYNEENDIRSTLEGVLALRYPNKEILVVDDSTDRTPEIVKEYAERGVKFLSGPRTGCCEAMNYAVEKATGDVFVAIDADVIPSPDFLDRLAEKYEAGADFVLVDMKVPNLDSMYARFIEFQHILVHEGRTDMFYSEGFSCRRSLALKVGVFDKGSYPVKLCRDWTLGKKMGEAGYRRVYDPSISVFHKAPDNFKEYWEERKERGRFSAFVQYFFLRKSLPFLFLKFLVKDVIFFLKFITIIPGFWYALRLSRYSENPLKNIFSLWFVYFLQGLAHVIGEWEGFLVNLKHVR